MNQEHFHTKEDREFFTKIEKFTDRELQELNSHYLSTIQKKTHRIMLNVQFFYYAFVLAILLYVGVIVIS